MEVITVYLHGFLDTYSEMGRKVEVQIEVGWTVRDVLQAVGVQADIIGVVLVNKNLVNKDTVIAANDRLDLYPLFGGG